MLFQAYVQLQSKLRSSNTFVFSPKFWGNKILKNTNVKSEEAGRFPETHKEVMVKKTVTYVIGENTTIREAAGRLSRESNSIGFFP